MKLEEIQALWDVDSVLELDRLTEHSLQTASLHNKYYKILIQERFRLKNFEDEYKEIQKEKWELFAYGADERHHKRGWEIPRMRIVRGDIDRHMEGDKDLHAASNKIVLQKEKVDFLNSIIQGLNRRSFEIKNAIEFEKFKNGQ